MTKARILLSLTVLGAVACLTQACGSSGSHECVGQTSGGQALSVCSKGPTLKGIDVSIYQGTVDWNAIKAAGMSFAIVRVSDGSNTPDTQFAANWPGTKKAGLVRGAYQFFRPSQNVTAQVNLFISKMNAAGGFQKGDLPPVLDLETADGQPSATVVANALAWLTQMEAKTGIRPIVYTAAFMSSVIGTSFSKYPLWVANYGPPCPTMPSGWTQWEIWQNTSTGSVGNISGNVDHDIFQGDMAALTKLTYGGATVTPADAGKTDVDAGLPPEPPPADTDAGADGSAGAAMGSGAPPTADVDAGETVPCP